ncbi:MAG: hypothetical protein JNK60_07005 [Acidobacteria bacterium]|nr:hypothetical protein [Acidobacteriota bacterium]
MRSKAQRSRSGGFSAETVLPLATALLVGAVPFVVDPRLPAPLLGSERFLECGAFTLLAVSGFAGFAVPATRRAGAPSLAAAGLAAALLISAATASSPAYALASSLLSLAGLALFLVLRSGPVPILGVLGGVLSLQAALLSGLALTQWLGIDLLPLAPDPLLKSRAVATLGNPNFLGSVLGPALFVCLARARATTGRARALALAAFGLSGLALLATRARAAILGALVAFLLVAALEAVLEARRDARKRWVLAAACGTLLASLAVALVMNFRPAWILDVNVANRLAAYHAATPERPLWNLTGEGRGGFASRFWDTAHADALAAGRLRFASALVGATDAAGQTLDPGSVHDDYLELWYEGGTAALALHLFLLLLAFGSGVRRALAGDRCASLLIGGLVVSALDAAFGFPLALPASLALFWVLVAALLRENEP